MTIQTHYSISAMKKLIFITLMLGLLQVSMPVDAQRIQQPLGRGVVVVKIGSNALITWRRLAQEPENCTYNVYVKQEGGEFTKFNANPLRLNNLSTSSSNLPAGCQVAVTLVDKGVESEMSLPYTVKSYDVRDVFMEISFDASPLNKADYRITYVWPCDLDGDGEMDFVVDRQPLVETETQKVEAYLRDGTWLWAIDMGPNERICLGQDDQVLAYDMTCDGKGEVVIQTSDGTRFWDKENNTWGLYVNHSTNPDSDGDGLIDYYQQNVRNAPRYMTVVDGMTGAEITSVEEIYNDHYNRTNKASLMGDEYNRHVGRIGAFYYDGIHPGILLEWHTRSADGKNHYYYMEGFSFDYDAEGKPYNWHVRFQTRPGNGSFHSIRIGDPDMDGMDEMIEGGWTMDQDGSVLFESGIGHGDRFRTSDIDPERPGLETFAVQQNAGDLLGQILYDATDGTAIKKWYLPSVGDVGRGECYDMTPDYKGWEMFSTMNGAAIYNAQGDGIGKNGYFPTEAIWWDGDLGRECLAAPDGHGYNCYVGKWNDGVSRLYEIAKESQYSIQTNYGCRALFWGDIIGDWREEFILARTKDGVVQGIVGFSTEYATTIDNIYSLMEDPAYRMQCCSKGYYQTSTPGFYLGWDMPRPPLPPVIRTDLVWGEDTWLNFDRSVSSETEEGRSVMYDLASPEAIRIDHSFHPSVMYLMTPRGKMHTFTGNGAFEGEMDVWKSQCGRSVVNIPMNQTGTTYISEGILEVNGTVAGPVELRAKGTLAGKAVLRGNLLLEGALNYEGGRLMPGSGKGDIDTITLEQSLNIGQRLFMEMDVRMQADQAQSDLILVKGDLGVNAPAVFSIATQDETIEAGRYKLLQYEGAFSGKMENFSVRGLKGYSYDIVNEDKAVWLVVNPQRGPIGNVVWSGATGSNFNYADENFRYKGSPIKYVSGDSLLFDDEAMVSTVTLNELFPVGQLEFNNNEKAYIISGQGGFSGHGALIKRGTGDLYLKAVKSDFTGKVVLNNGRIYISEFGMAGNPSSLGAGSSAIEVSNATLINDNNGSATDRPVVLDGTVTIEVPRQALAIQGVISGNGKLVKTGAGQLTFNNSLPNTFKGGILLEEGRLAQGSYKTDFGPAGSTITVKNGSIQQFYSTSSGTVPSFNYVVNIPESTDMLEYIMPGRGTVQGTWKGKGTTTFKPTYVRGDIKVDFSNYEGTLSFVKNGDYDENRMVQAMNMKKGRVNLGDGAKLTGYKAGGGTLASYTNSIGSLTGSGQLTNGTWNVGYDNTDFSFGGTINQDVVFNKVGTGMMKLSAGVGSATLNIKSGSLYYASTTAVPTTGTIIVTGENTELQAVGCKLGPVSMQEGRLRVGTGNGRPSQVYLEGSLNVSAGARISLNRSSVGNDKFYLMGGSVNMQAASIIEIIDHYSSAAFKSGDELQVFVRSGNEPIRISEQVLVLSTPLENGLYWDISELADKGILRVAGAVGLDSAKAEDDSEPLFDLMGRPVDGNPLNGVYIRQGKKIIVTGN